MGRENQGHRSVVHDESHAVILRGCFFSFHSLSDDDQMLSLLIANPQ